MFAVDRQHQAVEETPPFGGRAEEQPVHRRRQPHHAQMIAECRGRTNRLPIDPATPAGGRAFRAGGVDPGAERRQSQRALDLGGDSPGTVALDVGDILERRAPQAAPGREKRDRLQAIGLAGAVRSHQYHQIPARLHARRTVIAELRQREAMDAGGGHVSVVIAGLDPAIHRPLSGQHLRTDPVNRIACDDQVDCSIIARSMLRCSLHVDAAAAINFDALFKVNKPASSCRSAW